ncbi:MAG: AAA family ATPase [bacterium]
MALRDIVGQRVAVRCLRNVLESGAVPHAFLFHGPDGCGKGTTAKAFAQALKCEAPEGADACGRCGTCRRIERGTEVDAAVFTPAKREYGVEEVRALRESVFYRPNAGARKVIVIRKAEAFSGETANMTLKILEEPPVSTVFVLTSSKPYNLLPTIRSRTTAVPFRSLSIPETAEALERAGVRIAPERLEVLYNLFDGNAGAIAGFSTEEETERVVERVEAYLWETLTGRGEEIPTKVAEHLTALAGQLPAGKGETAAEKARSGLVKLLETCVLFLRRKAREGCGGGGRGGEWMRTLMAQARLMEIFLEAIRSIERNANPQLELEVAAIRIGKVRESLGASLW